MSSPDDSALLHAGLPYNPQLAREYYLRTRKLKGRLVGVQQTPSTRSKRNNATTVKKVRRVAKVPRLTSKQRQEAVNARVSTIRKRLDKLHDVLKDLLKKVEEKTDKAKTDKSKTDKSKMSNKTGSDSRKDLTTTQKREASVRSKDYYDKNKKLVPKGKSKEDLESDIYVVREKIRKIRAELKDAIEKARQQSSKSKTVKGR